MKRSFTVPAIFLALVLLGSFEVGRVHAAQPHMASALNHLRAARRELESAIADKGGHRGRAISIVNRAIGEVESGIEYSRSQ